MKILIVGAGRLAQRVVRMLSLENHKLTVVDANAEKLGKLRRFKNHTYIEADPLGLDFYKSVNLGDFDVVVCLTRSDKTNIIIGSAAKRLGAKKTIALFKEVSPIEDLEDLKSSIGIDEVVSLNRESAQAIADLVFDDFSGKSDFFAKGKMQVLSFRANNSPDLINKTIEKVGALMPFLIVALARDNKVFIPNGNTIIEKDDLIYIAGLTKDIQKFRHIYFPAKTQVESKNIMIVGGGEVCEYAAELMSKKSCNIKLIAKDEKNVKRLRRNLSDALVVRGDFEDFRVLEGEDIEKQDVFIAATDSDELNIVTGLMSKKYKVGMAISKVEGLSYSLLLDELSIDQFVNPIGICANRIVEIIRGNKGLNTFVSFSGRAEMWEVKLRQKLPIIDKKIKDLNLADGIIIAGIEREDGLILVPRGETVIRQNDKLIVFCKNESLKNLCKVVNPESTPTFFGEIFR
ncbi:Trk system potassium transporter TrkA [Peptoniphilus sp. GNH]|nr:Trk system potassium transporter TrkA [Peptoniphilus sp. GNH]